MVAFMSFIKRLCFVLSSVCLLLVLTAAASAQAVGSTRGLPNGEGTNSIQGRVLLPSDQQFKSLKVNLESTGAIGGMSTSTEQDGSFHFNGLSPGNYTVVIDGGRDFETWRESVTIDP